ncbi:MAG: sugar phosphate isomerase/epimerase [Armatimonadetes bacterium]|nr:sugar phosphate isomerase/epimerase [Armatimonadota bacterium]
MHVGILTAPFGDKSLDYVFEFAGKNGFGALEVASGPGSLHLDPFSITPERIKEIQKLMETHKVAISSLACYINTTDADPSKREANIATLKKLIDVASLLGVEVVCTMAGMPVPGKDKMKTIEEDCPQVLPGLCDYAAGKKINIALENWFATNIQHFGHWDRLFELVPHDNFGLNYDPSHLIHQQIDYIAGVERYGKRIFHTHAKDTEILEYRLRHIGNQASGWWRYVIPGLGAIRWGEYIASLRRVGYNGALSIEHEDGAVGVEEGFLMGRQYLSLFI